MTPEIPPTMTPEQTAEWRAHQKKRNPMMLIILLALIALIFAVSIFKTMNSW